MSLNPNKGLWYQDNAKPDFSADSEIDLYLFIGESTADGRGKVANVPIAYQYLLETHNNVQAWRNTTNALIPYHAETIHEKNPSFVAGLKRFGPDAQFVIRVMQNTNKSSALVKVAKGGTTLEPGVTANGDWRKSSADMYTDLTTELNAAIAALDTAGYTANIRGVFMLLGLNDATDATAALNFTTNFNNFVNNLYADFDLANANLYYCRPHASATDPTAGFSTNLAEIISQVDNFTDTRVKVIDIDATTLQNEGGYYLHADWEGEKDIGDLFYDTYKLYQ